jgi:hypothetical protein
LDGAIIVFKNKFSEATSKSYKKSLDSFGNMLYEEDEIANNTDLCIMR